MFDMLFHLCLFALWMRCAIVDLLNGHFFWFGMFLGGAILDLAFMLKSVFYYIGG